MAGRVVTGAERALLREAAVGRLMALDPGSAGTSWHVGLVAEAFGVHVRTVWRWVERARKTGDPGRKQRSRLEITDELRIGLAVHRANCASLWRELSEQPADSTAPVPGLSTLQRAVSRDLTRGQREGLRHGERARREYDVYFQRPQAFRNEVWEGDHMQAPVRVEAGGRLCKPWITWFIDCGTAVVCGAAITAGYPSRECVLAALRASISRSGSFGPFGGLPGEIRIDRGKDFLSHAVADSMAFFGVGVKDLPGYAPYLKGRVEALNGAAKKMLFPKMPQYTKAQTLANGMPVDPAAPPLRFEAFVADVLGWVQDWNTVWPKAALGGGTPQQAWQCDATPIVDIPDQHLALFTLEDQDVHVIGKKGVRFKNLHYIAPFMSGDGKQKVRVRWMPNHPEIIEVFDGRTGKYLGPATPSDQAGPEAIAEVLEIRAHDAKQLRKDLKAAERRRRVSYAAATTAIPPVQLGLISQVQADAELRRSRAADTARQAKPNLFPHRSGAPGWAAPVTPAGATHRGLSEDVDGERDDIDR